MSSVTVGLALACLIIWNVQVNVFVMGIDECTAGLKSCPDNSNCSDPDINTNGTALCTCKTGYTGNETMCKDINECDLAGICSGERLQCENTQGSYLCLCVPMYKAVNGTCVDVNECAEGTHGCHKDAECINFSGGFNCTCKTGFTGDGKTTCEDVNECAGSNHGCHSNATCENIPGSYVCSCKITVESGARCQVSSYCPTSAPEDCEDEDNDVVIILVVVTIILLVICLCALFVAILLFKRNIDAHANK